MYNTNGIRDCRELVKISLQRKISQIERFRTKMHLMFGNQNTFLKVHFLKQKSNGRRKLFETYLKQIAHGRLNTGRWSPTCTTNTGVDKRTIVAEKPRPQVSH